MKIQRPPDIPESRQPPTSHRSARSTYLMVEDGDSHRVVRLQHRGRWLLGSGEGVDIQLTGSRVGEVHARLELDGEQAHVIPLNDSEPLLINGKTANPRQTLQTGDRIEVGDAFVTFHGPHTSQSYQPPLMFERFRQRLDQELERSLRYGHPFTLMALRSADLTDDELHESARTVQQTVRTVDIVGYGPSRDLLILFPETAQEDADIPVTRVLTAVNAVAATSAGVALCPSDGTDPLALLEGARKAAESASEGTYRMLVDSVSRWSLGDHEVVVLDPLMKNILDLAQRVAASDIPVLIIGETGTGKEVIAKALHAWSKRSNRPLFSVNCAAVPETLIESELFGHERGAFSGAVTAKKGLFEQADGGTIFLDEIGELSLKSQAEFLRVLENKTFARVGSVRERKTDVRIIAATNRHLEEQISHGLFRRDLYFRLNTANLLLPPLRERPLDTPVLARHFLQQACEKENRPAMTISPEAMQQLTLHSWPGNVRELRNLMDYLAATCRNQTVHPDDFPPGIADSIAPWLKQGGKSYTDRPAETTLAPLHSQSAPLSHSHDESDEIPTSFTNIYEEIEQLERTRITQALKASDGVRVQAAALIGMPLRTFVSKLKKYGLDKIPSTRKRKRRSSRSS